MDKNIDIDTCIIPKVSIWSKAFISIFIINTILNLGQFMMNALIPKYAEFLQAPATIVGLVAGMFAITALSVRPIVGPSTSYFKKEVLFSFTVSIVFIAFICYGFANSIQMIMVGRLLHGVGMGFMAPVCLSMASDALPDEKMASGIGVFTLGQAIATAIGPSIGLALVERFGYNTTFFIGAGIMGLVFILSFGLNRDYQLENREFKIALNKMAAKEVLIPTIVMYFLAGAYACLSTFILIYGDLCGVKEIGLFFTAYAVCILISRPISGIIGDRYGIDKVVIPGMAFFAISFVLISNARSLPMFLVAAAVSAIGYGVCQPAIQAICMRLVVKERRGVAGNTIYIGVDAGFLTMPLIAGTIITLLEKNHISTLDGYSYMFKIMIIPIIIALVLFTVNRKKINAAQKI